MDNNNETKEKDMKTLVIHPTDYSTRFLTEIYKDHKDWTVITENVSRKVLKNQIKDHDRIVMLGHGTESGLIGHDRYVINSSLVYLLRDKVCFTVWCNADMFMKKYGIKGFYTGMIISEDIEANMCCVNATLDEIEASNWLFAEALQKAINAPDILDVAKSIYIGESHLVEFNKNNMYYE